MVELCHSGVMRFFYLLSTWLFRHSMPSCTSHPSQLNAAFRKLDLCFCDQYEPPNSLFVSNDHHRAVFFLLCTTPTPPDMTGRTSQSLSIRNPLVLPACPMYPWCNCQRGSRCPLSADANRFMELTDFLSGLGVSRFLPNNLRCCASPHLGPLGLCLTTGLYISGMLTCTSLSPI